jgi:hypothetical protein
MIFGDESLNVLWQNQPQYRYILTAIFLGVSASSTDNLKIILSCVARLQGEQDGLHTDNRRRLQELLGAEQLTSVMTLQHIVAAVLKDTSQDNTLLKQIWQSNFVAFKTKLKLVVEHPTVRDELTKRFGTHCIVCLEDVVLYPKQYPIKFLPTAPLTLVAWEQQVARELRAAFALQWQQTTVMVRQPNVPATLHQFYRGLGNTALRSVFAWLDSTNAGDIEETPADSEQLDNELSSLSQPVAKLPRQSSLAEEGAPQKEMIDPLQKGKEVPYCEACWLVDTYMKGKLRILSFFRPANEEHVRNVCANLRYPGLNDQDRYQILQDYMNDPENRNTPFYWHVGKRLGKNFFLEKKDDNLVAEKEAFSPEYNK